MPFLFHALANLRASVFLTSMARPLGRSAGNTLEIAESIECLRGGGPQDLRSLVLTLGAEMLRLANAAHDERDGIAQITRALDSGRALDTFRRVVEAQGGDPKVIDDPSRLRKAPSVHAVKAVRAGWLTYTDVRAVGNAIIALGGGRQRVEDTIDPTVGIVFECAAGDRVEAGQALFQVHHGERGLEAALEGLGQAFAILDAKPEDEELVLDRMLG